MPLSFQQFRDFRIDFLTPINHLLQRRVVREVGIVDHVGHEGILRFKSRVFVVLLQDFGKAAVRHDAKRLQQEQVRVQSINTSGKDGPQLEPFLVLDNVHPVSDPFFPYREFDYGPVEEVDRLVKLLVKKLEKLDFAGMPSNGFNIGLIIAMTILVVVRYGR